jgi:hypothetical protein
LEKDTHFTIVIDEEDSGDGNGDGDAVHPSNPATAALGNPTAVGADGFLKDVDVQSVDDNRLSCEDKRRDVDHFFFAPVVTEIKGKLKKYRTCKICP